MHGKNEADIICSISLDRYQCGYNVDPTEFLEYMCNVMPAICSQLQFKEHTMVNFEIKNSISNI